MTDDQRHGQEVVVRLLIFSGREDPEWALDADQAKHLAGRLQEAIGAEAIHPPPPGGLGYRGFLLHGLGNVGAAADVARVYRGVVSEGGEGAEQRHWRDNAGLEPWLLAQARERGHAQLLDSAGMEERPS